LIFVADKIVTKSNIVILTGAAINKNAYIPHTGFDFTITKQI